METRAPGNVWWFPDLAIDSVVRALVDANAHTSAVNWVEKLSPPVNAADVTCAANASRLGDKWASKVDRSGCTITFVIRSVSEPCPLPRWVTNPEGNPP